MSIVPSDAGSREAMTGAELALRLLAAFRGLVDELHDRPAAEGHPAARPIHGFALQAIGPQGATAAELGVRLGVSKQAAGKTIDGLEARGYVTRSADRVDARRKLIAITPTGRDLLARSAAIFERLRSDRVALLGEEQMAEVEAALRVLAPAASFPLDAAGWFGG